jgi:hypothetical protein
VHCADVLGGQTPCRQHRVPFHAVDRTPADKQDRHIIEKAEEAILADGYLVWNALVVKKVPWGGRQTGDGTAGHLGA